MTSHKAKEPSHTASSSGDLEERAAVPTTPQQLPPFSADTSELQRQKDRERLESSLEDVRHNLRTIDQELVRFAARLDASKDHDQRDSIKAKAKVFQDRRKALVAKEAFLLRKIDSFTRAAEVQRHEEAKRSLA